MQARLYTAVDGISNKPFISHIINSKSNKINVSLNVLYIKNIFTALPCVKVKSLVKSLSPGTRFP